MSDHIVKCDGCGQPGRRRQGDACPDHWFFIESIDRTIGKRGIYIVWACSEACRDGMWKRGPGRGEIDESGSNRLRGKKAPADKVLRAADSADALSHSTGGGK